MSRKEEKKENEKTKIVRLLTIFDKLWVKLLITAIIVIGLSIYISIKTSEEGQVTIVSESKLFSIVKKNQLNTAEFIYDGIAVKKNKKGDAVYFVKYDGIVVAGVDLDKDHLKIVQDDVKKKIIVTIPKAKINENKVDNKTIDIIFLDDRYNAETVHATAYKLAKKDLEEKVKDQKEFIEMAQEKSDSVIKALIQPLIDADGRGYDLVIKRSE